jgi:hypothetical protein
LRWKYSLQDIIDRKIEENRRRRRRPRQLLDDLRVKRRYEIRGFGRDHAPIAVNESINK